MAVELQEPATSYRLISADDHVDLSHDAIKANLATMFHSDYDAALMEVYGSMGSMMSAAANQLWREQNGIDGPGVNMLGSMAGRKPPAAGRAGHTDSAARLADMDTDGVEASVPPSQGSALPSPSIFKKRLTRDTP